MMTMGAAPYVASEMVGHFRHNAMFIGGNVRQAVNEGRADYTPVYLSEIEELLESGAMPIDVASNRSISSGFSRFLLLRCRRGHYAHCRQVRTRTRTIRH